MRLTHLLSRSILGYVHLEIGDYEQAQTYFLGAADMARDLNEIRDLTSILNNLGLIALKWDHFEQAYQHYSEALTLAYEIDHRLYVTILSNNLASAACSLDRYGEAYLLTMETIEMAHKIGYKLVLVYALDNFVTIAKGNKRFEAAATVLGAQDRLRQELNTPVVARDRDYYVERRDAFVAGLGQTGFDRAYQAGWQMSVNDAASYAQHHLYDV
jgi:tetratricopeptide (TPR) repeat protein